MHGNRIKERDTRCLHRAVNSLYIVLQLYMIQLLKGHHKGVTAIRQRSLVKYNSAFIHIPLCIYSAKLSMTMWMWEMSTVYD